MTAQRSLTNLLGLSFTLLALVLLALVLSATPGFAAKGRLEVYKDFYSKSLNENRTLRIYKPANFRTSQQVSLIIFNDGQNVFKNSKSPHSWQAESTVEQLISTGKISPNTLVLGLDHGPRRIDDYTPFKDSEYGGGEAKPYLDFVEHEVIPAIKSKYGLHKTEVKTYFVGSSLGGLVSFYAAWTRPHLFAGVASLSPSFWWSQEQMLKFVFENSSRFQGRLYLDIGLKEGSFDAVDRFAKNLLFNEFLPADNVTYVVERHGVHNEQSWARRLPSALSFLLK